MSYWLIKSEPSTWSWEQQQAVSQEPWTGVRNYQASNNMKAMKLGDLAFFYHSNEGREIVGICEVAKEYYPDPTDEAGRFGMCDFKAIRALPQPVTLAQMKAHPELQNLSLIKQSRLSVCPIESDEWQIICAMGGL
jgi:predicted RNA-binding protein with PUA-like domain